MKKKTLTLSYNQVTTTGSPTPETLPGVTTSVFPSPAADFRFLRRSGFALARSLRGGLDAWIREFGPLEPE